MAPTTVAELAATGLYATFIEDFDGLSLQTSARKGTWKTSYYFGGRTLTGNGELQIYVDPDYRGKSKSALGLNPFSIENGELTITARPTDPALRSTIENKAYTSGLITTETSFSQTYGYFEIRAALPTGKGLWPAFWMLPSDKSWPPEIDVFEVLGHDPTTVYTTAQTPERKNPHKAVKVYDTSDFHTYGLNWTADTLTWYFDGQKVFEAATPSSMHKPMYMLVNLAVGGTWPGAPNATTPFPAEMTVDYVHAYSHTPPVSRPVITFSNAGDAADLTQSFTAASVESGSSATFTAQQMRIDSLGATATATVSYDADGALTATSSTWNAVKNATVKATAGGTVTLFDFLNADITVTGGDATVTAIGTKRGSIVTHSGSDQIAVAAFSNDVTRNVITIDSGAGNDAIGFTAGTVACAVISAGPGDDRILVTGGAVVVDGGPGNDVIALETAAGFLSGGAGADIFVIGPGAVGRIVDFDPGTDLLRLKGVPPESVQLRSTADGTAIDLAGGQIVLVGLAADQASQAVTFA